MNRFSSIIITSLCALLGLSQAHAQVSKSFVKDGLRYTVLQGQNVSVAYNDEDSVFLSGRVVIPAEVVNPADMRTYQVVALADTAFKGCDLVETIVLPASLQSTGRNIVDHCFRLSSFELASGSQHFSVVDGVLLSADGKVLVCCPTARSGQYVLPASVREIAPTAFSSCKNFTKVVLPEGLKAVPDYAFYECWGLAEVEFPASLEEIGDFAFDGTVLQFLLFKRNLKHIGSHAFARSSMVECMCLGSQPATLGQDAFGDDMKYTRLYVPASATGKYKQSAWKVFPTVYPGNKSRRWVGSYR